jgi:hypothetical protein
MQTERGVHAASRVDRQKMFENNEIVDVEAG